MCYQSSRSAGDSEVEMSDERIIHVYRFTNGMVVVFDRDGEQIPRYQGLYYEHEQLLHDACGPAVNFHLMNWNTKEHQEVSRERFFAN